MNLCWLKPDKERFLILECRDRWMVSTHSFPDSANGAEFLSFHHIPVFCPDE